MTTYVCFQVHTRPLTVVVRNPTHRVPTCDTTPLLIFSTIGVDDHLGDASKVDNVCGEPDCVRVFIDGIEVPVARIGEAYGYDQYGADGLPWGAHKEDYPEAYGYAYGYDCDPSPKWGYGDDPGHYGDDDFYGSYGYDTYDGYSWHHYGPTYGTDKLPGVLHVFQLPDIAPGRHSIRVVVKNTAGIESEATEYFIVDPNPPVITITSPKNDTINPLSEVPTLEYTITDFSGVLTVNVNIDNRDYGWLPSGTLLDFLKSGLHVITITARDMATNGCPEGNLSSATVRFNLLKPIIIDEIGDRFYLGTDSTTKSKPADAVFEEFRVLNTASTEANVLDEFKILRAKIRFQLRSGQAVLSPEEVFTLQQIGVTADRINLPKQTLMLCHYDNNVDSLPGIDNTSEGGPNLSNPSSEIIDAVAAGRRIEVIVKYNEGQYIDRELITELINRIIPAFTEAGITFEEIPLQA